MKDPLSQEECNSLLTALDEQTEKSQEKGMLSDEEIDSLMRFVSGEEGEDSLIELSESMKKDIHAHSEEISKSVYHKVEWLFHLFYSKGYKDGHESARPEKLDDRFCGICSHKPGTLGCVDSINNKWTFNCEDGIHQYVENEYRRGICDAWQVASRIVKKVENGGLASGDLSAIFGSNSASVIFDTFSYSDISFKLSEWDKAKSEEKKKDDAIANLIIGDEVMWRCKDARSGHIIEEGPFVFIEPGTGYKGCSRCLYYDISNSRMEICEYPAHQLFKTGRAYPELATVMKEMAEPGS